MNTPLPEQLAYLSPVIAELSKLPADELDDDVDVSGLETALRARVRGLTIPAAKERVEQDCHALQRWLESADGLNDAASWVLGFLKSRPGALVRRLLSPAEESAAGITIAFDPPEGWSVKQIPLGLAIRKGKKEIGTISAISASDLAVLLRKNEVREEKQNENRNPLAIVGLWSKNTVSFGGLSGHKFLYRQTAPVPWKSLQYLLEVDGHAANIRLDAGGADFDESRFEEKLSTLRIIGN